MNATSPTALSAALYFDRPARPSRQAGGEPEPPGGARTGRVEKQLGERQRRAGEREQQRAVGHHPAAGGGEEKRRDVEREQRDEAGARIEQPPRQREVSQPVAANSAMNGSRVAAPSPNASAAKWAIH